MFAALFVAGLIVIATASGKAFLTLLASLPVGGAVAAWYMGYVGDLGVGPVANLVYGAMALQLLLMALTPVLYGPALIRKAAAWLRSHRMVAHG